MREKKLEREKVQVGNCEEESASRKKCKGKNARGRKYKLERL